MWNRRKEEESAPKPAMAPPKPSELAKEGIPMSTLPSRASDPTSDSGRGGNAVLGKSVNVKGQIFSREDLTIDGEVEGTVELHEHRLTVGPNGKVNASIKAREIIVIGTVHGNVEATEKLSLRREAKLVGDIRAASVGIEDGAYFKGNIDIVRVERPAAAPPKPQAAATSAPSGSTTTPAITPAAQAAGELKR